MTEADEIAESIFGGCQIDTYADAERIAAHHLRDQGVTVQANVADALWLIAQAKGKGLRP